MLLIMHESSLESTFSEYPRDHGATDKAFLQSPF